jgi:hypothetical protein
VNEQYEFAKWATYNQTGGGKQSPARADDAQTGSDNVFIRAIQQNEPDYF